MANSTDYFKKLKNGNTFLHYSIQSQSGICNKHTFNFPLKIYSNYKKNDEHTCGSSIYNLEFSNDGRVLIVAKDNKSISLMDPITRLFIKTIENAHEESVNCIKFINDYLFATGSDDDSINVWDIRNVDAPLKKLLGHTSWVKSLNYSDRENCLISSGFDGNVIKWDLNQNDDLNWENVISCYGLGRTLLSPDQTKFFIAVGYGINIIVHDVDFSTLSLDFGNFKPKLYKIMQNERKPLANAIEYSHLFDANRKKNRIEFIADYPRLDYVKITASYAVHPQGDCLISRNISKNKTEWLCVHHLVDLRESDQEKYLAKPVAYIPPQNRDEINNILENVLQDSDDDEREELNQPRVNELNQPRVNGLIPELVDESGRNIAQVTNNEEELENQRRACNNYFYRRLFEDYLPESRSTREQIIYGSKKRLVFYKQESNVGNNWIKEIKMSKDGLVICSPHDAHCRLLAFGDNCEEMYVNSHDCNPKELSVVGTTDPHPGCVLTSAFSPIDYTLVTGCSAGNLLWHSWAN